jgi:hypothetical protein
MKLFVDRDDPVNWIESNRPLSPSEICWMWKLEKNIKRRPRYKQRRPVILSHWPFPVAEVMRDAA